MTVGTKRKAVIPPTKISVPHLYLTALLKIVYWMQSAYIFLWNTYLSRLVRLYIICVRRAKRYQWCQSQPRP